MKKRLLNTAIKLTCFLLLFTFGFTQLAIAQDMEIYKGNEIELYNAQKLEGSIPDLNNTDIQNVELIDGTVNFDATMPNGSKYDILRSDNGGKFIKLTDFPQTDDFIDKYILPGHTYYYVFVIYDSAGKVIKNIGPYKAVVKETPKSKVIVLQIDNLYASINGTSYKLDASPFIQDGRTMVPVKFVSEALGAKVSWNGSERKVTVELNGIIIELWIDQSAARVNGETVYMDVPAMISNDRTVLPISFISKNLNLSVGYEDTTKKITLTEKQSGNTPAPAPTPKPTPAPASSNESTLKNIVSSNTVYFGVSTQGYTNSKYSITFTNYNASTGAFKGSIEWIGFYVTDQIEGRVEGDKLIFKQISRYQNNKTVPMDCTVTMKVESSRRISGTWYDTQTSSSGTTYFEFESLTSPVLPTGLITKYDLNGFPSGQTTLSFGKDNKFTGEVKVESGNLIATGVVNYSNGIKVIGRFVNGKPDGMNSIIYPDKKAYLIDFTYGKPVKFFKANNIPVFKSNEIQIFKANNIEVFKADNIEIFKADTIDVYTADTIDVYKADNIDVYIADTIAEYRANNVEPYKANMVELFQATPVEADTTIVNVEKFESEAAELNPPGDYSSIPSGGYTSPDYTNPLVQAWTSHMLALPYLMNNNMYYSGY